MVVAPEKTWSGGGFFIEATRSVDLSSITNDYVMHIALKSKQAKSSFVFILADKGKVCLGSDVFNDNGEVFQPYANFTRDGEWNEIEIPMNLFLNQMSLRDPLSKANIISFLAGGLAGTTIDIDALFIYKPAAE